jgi:hypothetical protein
MKGLFACLAVLLAAAPAKAQQPRLPVPLSATEGYGACSTAFIRGVENSVRVVAVRSGPSRRERVLAHLPDGRGVYACVRHGDWFGIIFERQRGETRCASVLTPQRESSLYRGPCPSGWVHFNYLAGYADFISP